MDPTARASARSFNSVYRLTLRALAASTRQHPTSTKNLRTLYRPVFGDAAVRFRQYAANQSNETRSKLQQWNSRRKSRYLWLPLVVHKVTPKQSTGHLCYCILLQPLVDL